MDFTYHHHLYQSVNNLFIIIISLLRLLVSFFPLRYIFIFCRHNFSASCHFDFAVPVIQDAIPSWYLSQHKFISTQFGTSVGCCRSCLYLSSIPLPTPSLLFPPLPRNFQTQSIGFLLSSIHFPPVYI